MRSSDWSSDVCSSDLLEVDRAEVRGPAGAGAAENARAVILDRLADDIHGGEDLRVHGAASGQQCRGLIVDHCVDRSEFLLHVHGREPGHLALLPLGRSEEHTSELQSLMRISYAVFCLKKKKHTYRLVQKTEQEKEQDIKQNK